jgi:hypothetical protein
LLSQKPRPTRAARARASTLAGCLALAAASLARAQADGEPAAAGPEAAGREAPSPVFFLRDRSKIAGSPSFEELEVLTQYGVLKVPKADLVSIRFARRIPADLQARIDELIAGLGSKDFDTREAASKALAEIGAPASEFLRKAAKSSGDEDVKSHCQNLVDQIDAQAAVEEAAGEEGLADITGRDDEVTTARMTIKGTVPAEEFAIRSRYGELRVRIADLTGVVFRSSGVTSAKVDVSPQHQPPGNWYDTKLELTKGQRLKIEASGMVTVRNYGVSAGPEGNREWGPGTGFANFPMLALVGRVGKRGQPFLVGTQHNGKARGSGRLYLAIVSFTPHPGGATGSYRVKVETSAAGEP